MAGRLSGPSPYEVLATHLRDNYPDVPITFMMDGLFIHQSTAIRWGEGPPFVFRGLLLKYKRPDTRINKRDGSWASAKIAEEAASLERWMDKGYMAQFAVGTEAAIEFIDGYLAPTDQPLAAS